MNVIKTQKEALAAWTPIGQALLIQHHTTSDGSNSITEKRKRKESISLYNEPFSSPEKEETLKDSPTASPTTSPLVRSPKRRIHITMSEGGAMFAVKPTIPLNDVCTTRGLWPFLQTRQYFTFPSMVEIDTRLKIHDGKAYSTTIFILLTLYL